MHRNLEPLKAEGTGRGWWWLPPVAAIGVGAGLLFRLPDFRTIVGFTFMAFFMVLVALLYFRASDRCLIAVSRLLLAIFVLQGSFGMTILLFPEEGGLDLKQRIARAAFILPAATFIGLLAFVAHRLPRELGHARRKAMAEAMEAMRVEAEPGQAEALWLQAERSAREAGIDPPTRDYLRILITEDRTGDPA